MKFYKETKIGIVVTLVLAGFIWGLNFLKGRNFFTTTKEYYAIYNNIGGLKKSSPVSANGYTIGRVSEIEFLPGNISKVIVELSIERQFQIPKNSIIEIYNSDLMGSKAVNVVLGSSYIMANDKDTLVSRIEEDLSSVIAKQVIPLKEKSEHLMVSIDSVMVSLNNTLDKNTQRNIKQSINGLNDLIVTQREKIEDILNNLQSVSANLKASNQSITRMVKNTAILSDSLAASKLKQAISQANLALIQTNILLKQVNSGNGTVSKLIKSDSVYNSLQKTISDLDSLIVDLNKNPKRYVQISLFSKKEKEQKKK